MRPVDKGAAPNVKFKSYQDAEPYLEKRIGAYCSYCEFPISHVPEVEHKESKAKGGSLLAWNNLLLACKYCNTRKNAHVDAGERDLYIWPDEDDTFHCFSYREDIPKLNENYFVDKEASLRERAERLYQLIDLGNMPVSPKDKDRRYQKRSEARNIAEGCREKWKKMKDPEDRISYYETMLDMAKAEGFFSVWMEVFKGEDEVRNGLIESFIGTRREYCND